MAIYHLRMYKLPALIVTLVLVVCEMIVLAVFVKKLHPVQTVFIFIELISLSTFISLMILKYLSIIKSVLIFDIVYLFSNCTRLVSMVTQIILVARKNRADKRRQDMLAERRMARNKPLEVVTAPVQLSISKQIRQIRNIYFK